MCLSFPIPNHLVLPLLLPQPGPYSSSLIQRLALPYSIQQVFHLKSSVHLTNELSSFFIFKAIRQLL